MECKVKTIIEYSTDPIKEKAIKNNFKSINDHLNSLNTIDIFKNKEINYCPYCKNSNFIKNGKFKGIQRYKCKNRNCSKTFSAKTNSPFSYSKKNITLWMKYLSLMNSGTSIRSCARILGINIATSFYWRHKILVAEASNNNFKILKDYVEANKIMIKENFKGNKNSKTFSKEKIFIICAMDNNKSILSKAVCRYSISLASISKNFYPNLDKSAFLATSGDRCLVAFAKKHNSTLPKTKIDKFNEIKSESLNAKNTFSYITLPHIHSFSFNICRWLKRFKGVATKYLENYLSWYILDYKSNYSLCNSNQIILFRKLISENAYLRVKDFSTFKLSYQYTCIGNY